MQPNHSLTSTRSSLFTSRWRPSGQPAVQRRLPTLAAAVAITVILGGPLTALSHWQRTPAALPGGMLRAGLTAELASGNIHTVFVDRDHVLWAGANSGVDRYDGRWRSLTSQDGLPEGPIRAIAQSGDGTLWFGGEGGLARANGSLDDQSWRIEAVQPAFGPVYALVAAPDGRLWAGTDSGLVVHSEAGWSRVPLHQPGGLPARVLALAAGSDDVLWAGGDTLHRIDTRTAAAEPVAGGPQVRIQALLVTPTAGKWPETLWVGVAGQGLWSYSDHWRRFTMPEPGQSAEGIASNDVLALARDDEGVIWIGTNGGGVSLFHPDRLPVFWGGKNWRTLTTRDGLAADAVGGIALDSSGAAWLATIAGISRLEVATWRALTTSELPAIVDATTVFFDPKGRIWFGSDSQGVVVLDGQQVHHLTAERSGLPENMVRSIVVDGSGTAWIGTARQGIARAAVRDLLTSDGAATSDWQLYGGDLLGSNVIRGSLLASDGSLWFGTYNGVHRYTPASGGVAGRWTGFTDQQGLTDNIVSQNALAEDVDGNLWVGASSGVNRLAEGAAQWSSYRLGAAGGSRVLSVAASRDRAAPYSVWAGDETGAVFAFDKRAEQWVGITQLGSPVYALLPPDDGYLWIGTAAGLVKLDVDERVQRVYGREHGLRDSEVHVLARDPQGALWIGTRTGVVRHRPEAVAPSVRIAAVNGRSPDGGVVSLLARTPIGVAVDGADLATPASDLEFRARIVELDPAWQVRPDRHWSFPPLNAGNYTLEVQAVDNALNFSSVARLRLAVAPSAMIPVFGRVSAVLAVAIALSTLTAAAGLGWVAYLSTRHRQRRRTALRRRFNPYVSGEPIATGDMFFGRHAILSRIVDTLHENSIMIHGERRIGKTSLLLQLTDHLRTAADREFLFVPVYVDLEGTLEMDLFSAMMESLVACLPRYLDRTPELSYSRNLWSEYDHRSFARDLDAILDALAETTEKAVRVVLLLDEMDVINAYQPVTQQQLRRIFMRSSAHSLGAVVAGVDISKFWERVESPWYNLFNEVELGPLSETAARDLVLEPVKGVYQVAPEAVAYITLHARGKPYLIQQHCMETVNQMLAAGRRQMTLDDARRALLILQQHRRAKAQPARRRPQRTPVNSS